MVNIRARNCKILATLGPASEAPPKIQSLFRAGADCFRFNFSHGDLEGHERRFKDVRAIEAEEGRPITIVGDLQGPKIRVGDFDGGAMDLRYGDEVTLEVSDALGKDGLIPVPHPELIDVLQPADILKLDDGKMQLSVLDIGKGQAKAKVTVGGKLSDHKGINIPGRRLPVSALTDQDKEHLEFAIDQGVDFIALSFVQRPEDVQEAKEIINGRARIISKIEKPAALDDLGKIIRLSDAIMVARGDLGVELSLELVPVVQREIIRKSRGDGRPVIVATQMLESMIESSAPTRAETSDVATAVYQGADAVMLSAESAVGRHPEVAVAIMDRVIQAVEQDPQHWSEIALKKNRRQPTTADAISKAAHDITELLNCQAILAFTNSGATAVRMSRERPHCKVLGLTAVPQTARQLSLVWGVHSVITEDIKSFEEMENKARNLAKVEAGLTENDPIIVTAGIPFGVPGSTNTLKILQFDED